MLRSALGSWVEKDILMQKVMGCSRHLPTELGSGFSTIQEMGQKTHNCAWGIPLAISGF